MDKSYSMSPSSLSSLSMSPSPSQEEVDPKSDLIQPSMPPPPEATYATEQELFESIQAWAKQHSYCFRIGRSKIINDKSRKKVYYECDRAGRRPSINRPLDDRLRPQERRRFTSTSKTGCEFSVVGVQVDDHHWELRQRPDPKFSTHNHSSSYSAMAHAIHRQLNEDLRKRARELHDAGINKQLIIYNSY